MKNFCWDENKHCPKKIVLLEENAWLMKIFNWVSLYKVWVLSLALRSHTAKEPVRTSVCSIICWRQFYRGRFLPPCHCFQSWYLDCRCRAISPLSNSAIFLLHRKFLFAYLWTHITPAKTACHFLGEKQDIPSVANVCSCPPFQSHDEYTGGFCLGISWSLNI